MAVSRRPPGGRQNDHGFASGKDRAVPGAELHTNFKLSTTGEYLALVEPDAATVAFEYAPAYPPQLVDVSFGLPQAVSAVHLYTAGEPARILIPASDALGLDWTAVGFDDGGWIEGATGVGYSFRSEYDAVIQTNVRAAMKGCEPERLCADCRFTSTMSATFSR